MRFLGHDWVSSVPMCSLHQTNPTMWGPPVTSWFRFAPVTIDINTINHSYWSYVHQLSYRTGASLIAYMAFHFATPVVNRGWAYEWWWKKLGKSSTNKGFSIAMFDGNEGKSQKQIARKITIIVHGWFQWTSIRVMESCSHSISFHVLGKEDDVCGANISTLSAMRFFGLHFLT